MSEQIFVEFFWFLNIESISRELNGILNCSVFETNCKWNEVKKQKSSIHISFSQLNPIAISVQANLSFHHTYHHNTVATHTSKTLYFTKYACYMLLCVYENQLPILKWQNIKYWNVKNIEWQIKLTSERN